MTMQRPRLLTGLSLLLAASLAVVSIFGAFVPGTYQRDAPSMAAQGRGQDLVDLFLVVPLLILSLIGTLKGGRASSFVFGGTVLYILYSFVVYAFGVHFNGLFHLYCLTLGLSCYLFILVIGGLNRLDVEDWFAPRLPTNWIGAYLILIAALFYLLWLRDTVPAAVHGAVPATVSDCRLLVNPVHVLDMALALPGLAIAATLLMKKRRLGYILAPQFLVFTMILTAALVGMTLKLKAEGLGDDTSVAGIFVVLAAVSGLFLGLVLKALKDRQGAGRGTGPN